MYDSDLSLAHSLQCQPSNRPTATATCTALLYALPQYYCNKYAYNHYLRIYAREVIREIFKFSLHFGIISLFIPKTLALFKKNPGVGPLCVSSLKTRVLGANYEEKFEKRTMYVGLEIKVISVQVLLPRCFQTLPILNHLIDLNECLIRSCKLLSLRKPIKIDLVTIHFIIISTPKLIYQVYFTTS